MENEWMILLDLRFNPINCFSDQFVFDFDESKYNCLITNDKELLNEMDEFWNEKLKSNNKLFNGTKFRLARVISANNKNILCLGLTDYKQFITTHHYPSAFARLRLESLQRTNQSLGNALMSNNLGNCCLLITSDSYVVFIKRSKKTGEFSNAIDLPGGHAEPSNVEDLKNVECIQKEIMYDSILKEIQDEVNIDSSNLNLKSLVVLGITSSHENCFKPSICFRMGCNLTMKECFHKYNEATQLECYESSKIYFVNIIDLQQQVKKHGHGYYFNYSLHLFESCLLEEEIFPFLTPNARFCIEKIVL